MIITNRPAAMNVTLRRAAAGLNRSSTFMSAMPSSEVMSPTMMVMMGSATASSRFAA